MKLENIIQGLVFSEHSANLASTQKVYTLKVDLSATKEDIKKAVKKMFDVDVINVNTLISRGKVKRRMRTRSGGGPVMVKKPNIKKAFVKLKPGQELPFGALSSAGIAEQK